MVDSRLEELQRLLIDKSAIVSIPLVQLKFGLSYSEAVFQLEELLRLTTGQSIHPVFVTTTEEEGATTICITDSVDQSERHSSVVLYSLQKAIPRDRNLLCHVAATEVKKAEPAAEKAPPQEPLSKKEKKPAAQQGSIMSFFKTVQA